MVNVACKGHKAASKLRLIYLNIKTQQRLKVLEVIKQQAKNGWRISSSRYSKSGAVADVFQV